MALMRAVGLGAGLSILNPVGGGLVPVPGASFETPVTSFVSVEVNHWQKASKPSWYDEGGGFLWDQLVGVFRNTPPGSGDHIENLDGHQALWLFAVPEVAAFQDFESMGGNDVEPAPVFDALYNVGSAYRLTVGVIGGGGNMIEGTPLELRLYYRDDAGERRTVAATNVTHSLEVFPTRTRFVDFAVVSPPVAADAPWAGQHIGIEFRSTARLETQGGFWDLDQVRLEEFEPPRLTDPSLIEGRLFFRVTGEPGIQCEILSAPDAAAPSDQWLPVATLENPTGEVEFTETTQPTAARYYRCRLVL